MLNLSLPRLFLLLPLMLLAPHPLAAQQLDLTRATAAAVPSGAASTPVSRPLSREQNMMELRADFQNDRQSDRAAWDLPLNLNLAQSAGIRLRFRCSNPAAASQFNLYIQAGQTWYSATFAPARNGAWEEIIIPKTSFMPEGTATSWSNCAKIRLAAWRGAGGPLLWQIQEIECLQPNISIAILRAGAHGNQRKEAYAYARHLGNALNLGGLQPAILDEDDCSEKILQPYKLILLPLPEAASTTLNNTLLAYLRRGGRAGFFHVIPPSLAAAAGFPAGTFTRGNTLPAPIAGIRCDTGTLPSSTGFRQQSTAFLAVKPAPGNRVNAWWQDTRGNSLGHPALLESANAFWMTHVFLNQDGEACYQVLADQISRFVPGIAYASALAILRQAQFAYAHAGLTGREHGSAAIRAAEKAFHSQSYPAARVLALQCMARLRHAEIPAEATAAAGEMRAAWFRNVGGVPGLNWQDTANLLAQSGINAVFPNMANAVTSAYPSRHLTFTQGRDRLSECIAACRPRGIQVHVWLSCLGVEDLAPAQRETLARNGQLQRNDRGAILPWLCPTQSRNRQQLIAAATELAGRYAIDGINLDLIRYPGTNGCHCHYCKNAFAAFKAQNPGPAGDWNEFRRRQITTLVQEIASAARRQRPSLKISAAVYPDWGSARNSVAQDWARWPALQAVDFLCPMNYRASAMLFAADLQRQSAQLSDSRKLLPGIGVSSERLDAAEVARQVQCARNAGTAGFILFEYTAREAHDLVPKLRLNR